MKPTNKIKRHHYKSDCQIIERFYSYDDGTAVQVPVPERIKIEYYIDKGKGSIVVERKGDYCHNCSVSDDGMTLIAAIPLAKHPIGRGRLLCDKVEYIDDPLFPGGYKAKVTPMLTSIELWSQASDNDKSSAYGELLLAKIIRGKDGEGIPAGGSAGQLLSKKSDNNFDTEWVDVPTPGVKIEVDATMSETSTNPVQNKTIKSYVDNAIEDVEANQIEVEDVVSLPDSPMKGGRLILEWSNVDAEVLQPVSYDSATKRFTVDTMPSWLPNDGDVVEAVLNYSDDLLVRAMYGTLDVGNAPFFSNNLTPAHFIRRISETEIEVIGKADEATTTMTIQDNPNCSYFYYTLKPANIGFKLGDRTMSGVRKYCIRFTNAYVQFEKFWDGLTTDDNLTCQNAYNGHWSRVWAAPRPIENGGEYIIEVDYDNMRYRYLGYEVAGMIRTALTARSYYLQKANNIEPWSNIWGGHPNVYFKFDGKYVGLDTKISVYEIYD